METPIGDEEDSHLGELQGICRVILTEMQGEPIQFPAESHCAIRSWKGFSLKQRAGRS